LRQSLTVVMGTLGIVALKLGEHDQPIIGRALAAATRLSQALDSILEASRLEFDGVEPKIRPFTIGPLLAELRDEHGPDARRKGLTFTIVGSSAYVVSDPMLLASILHNLVGNAIKYTERGGVLIGCRLHGDTLRIEVCDTGVGIPAEMLEAIFDEYRRLDPSHATGFGLGLAIARRTAELLGHELTVRSAQSKGSSFSLTVPLHAAPSSIAMSSSRVHRLSAAARARDAV
jgi:signal transduction histidine kinase